jgi:alkylhydroperoxidase/carboxymuconolactone decarboxylase family protein YurZ
MSILKEVAKERERQISKGYDAIHDDYEKLFTDFIEDIESYNLWCRQMYRMGSLDKARRRMVQIAALAVSAVEYIDRNRLSTDEYLRANRVDMEQLRNEKTD